MAQTTAVASCGEGAGRRARPSRCACRSSRGNS